MLSLNNFSKSYGSIEVLRVNHLLLESGIFWVKGENGSGKSTFLKAVAGIIDCKGTIQIENTIDSKTDVVAYRKRVNFAEAEANFPTFLTGFDLIRLFAEAKGAMSSQVEYYVTTMNMNEYIHDLVGTYSSGMLKKLSIVLAFLGNPTVILLDEPLITLDQEAISVVYQWIKERFQHHQVSFLISSHQALALDNDLEVRTLLVQNHTLNLLPL
ncbi:MAG: ABC transporter ATP-binding protein [Spirosomataceae bacterium]